VGGVDQGPPGEVSAQDFGGGIAVIETVQFPATPFADQDQLRIVIPELLCMLDVAYRNYPACPICEGIAGHRESPENVDNYDRPTGIPGAFDKIRKTHVHGVVRFFRCA
jgi:hypothetical protein